MHKKVLLVQPDFPIPKKRKIGHDFLPIGLLKIGTYLKGSQNSEVELVLGNKRPRIVPDEIWITTLFTYWSEYVHESADYYRRLFPKTKIIVGGIYATLMPENAKRETGGTIKSGLHKEAEEWCRSHDLDETLLECPIDFQILHGMRGCFRRCEFCGTWKIEPEETFESTVANLIRKNHVVFYDNNFLRNPKIREILGELSNLKVNGKRVKFESQSGFDGRIMNDEIAGLLKAARFVNPRIAWDNSLEDERKIHRQIQLLLKAGYKAKDIYVFILYNWRHGFDVVEKKRLKCWDWGVQISDCRFRPLDQLYDHFNSRRRQSSKDYYISENWTDDEVKQFRLNVRRHNICLRHGFPYHSKKLERMGVSKRRSLELRGMSKRDVKKSLDDAWYPSEYHGPSRIQQQIDDYGIRTIPRDGAVTRSP